MKMRWTRGVLTVGMVLAGFMLMACEIGSDNDVVDHQERERQMAPPPQATDLPPGLSEDLPRTTQPTTATMPTVAKD